MERTLVDLYFEYVKDTEPPVIFHRWAWIGAVSAWMGRNIWFPFGDSRIFPNHYIMFVGHPGTRKTTAIKKACSIIDKAGYRTFGPQKTSQEKFLQDFAEGSFHDFEDNSEKGIDVLSSLNLSVGEVGPSEIFITADEFNVFMGAANIDFQATLGEFWDWDNPARAWSRRLKTSKSITIFQPTVNILAGNTPQGFAAAFPLESIGQGFMSRLILVYSDPSGKKITIPTKPSQQLVDELIGQLIELKQKCKGEMTYHASAYDALDTIYKSWQDMEDARFKHYSTRRFTHLIKLCTIIACMRFSMRVDVNDILLANTILAFTESHMPKAIGELGKARNAEAANKIMQVLYEARKGKTFKELWQSVRNDLKDPQELGQVVSNLEVADKLVRLTRDDGETLFLAKKKPVTDLNTAYVKLELLRGREIK